MPSTATDRLQGLTTSVAVKAPCKVASTTSLTLSGEQTIGGVSCVTGDRVLYALSGGSVSNGIWIVSTGAWSRAKDFDGTRDAVTGTLVLVAPGTDDAEVYVVATQGDIVVGTTALTIEPFSGTGATLLADLANSANVALGDALFATKRTETGASALTGHALNQLRPLTPEDFGAVGDGVTDDYAALLALFTSGAKRVLLSPGKNYLVSQTPRTTTSGLVIDGYGATITSASVNASGLLIGYTGSAFSKTDNVTVKGATFVGADTGAGTNYSYAIGVQPPTTSPYVKGGGCSRIRVIDCHASGHAIGVMATAADDVKVVGGSMGGMKYHSALGSGGYGVLYQTCFKVGVYGTCFTGESGDRHAVYISADPSRTKDNNNVCKGVILSGLDIDWTGVSATTGFESAIVLRSPENCSIFGCGIQGGYSCIDYEGENGNGKNLAITGNTLDSPESSGSERACLNFVRTSGSYICTGITVVGNTFLASGANLYNISLVAADQVSIEANALNQSSGVAIIKFGGSVTNAYIGGGTIKASSANSVYYFSGTGNSSITIGASRREISGTNLYNFVSTPTSLKHDFVRVAAIRANSTASPVILSDPDGILASVASDTNGIAVTFSNHVADVTYTNMNFGCANSTVVNAYYRSAAGQQVVIGVLSAASTPLAAASNSYDITIYLLS